MRSDADRLAAITDRLDRNLGGAGLWRLLFLLSLGAFFEIYDIFLTAYLSPGLVRSGIFHAEGTVFWGMSSQAIFAAVTFAGLFVGTIVFSSVADRYGRRPIFAFALLWYTVATVVMATRSTALGIFVWRFVAGVGVGVELVTVDAYIAELVPRASRGRAFAFNAFVQFLAVPAAALLAALLVPRDPWGVAGWRWVALFAAAGAVVVWIVRRQVPESPRWLAEHGRFEAALEALEALERRYGRPRGTGRAPPPAPAAAEPAQRAGDFGSYRGRVALLVVFQIFQAVGYYGFGNWMPTLLAREGRSVVQSLDFSLAIALAYPIGPLLCVGIADRFEPKWQIVAASLGIGLFGLLFGEQSAEAGIIGFGVLVTFANCAMSFAFHNYQTELFPTRIRARAVGFCYSFSRLSTVGSSFVIAYFLARFGTPGVVAFIASCMGVVAVVIGAFGPRTRGRSLEEISG